MTKTQFIEKLEISRSFFKEVTYDKGLMGLLFNNYKSFKTTGEHWITRPLKLSSYKPEAEGMDQGFGEYGIFAAPINEQGMEELPSIVEEMNRLELLRNIPQIRYESRGISFFAVDPGELDEPSDMKIRSHSTPNLLVYALTVTDEGKYGPLNSFDHLLVSSNSLGRRYVLPFQGNRYLNGC